ncbi:MAG: large ribosomal subunit protein bL28, partial [Terriglobales bacterium]
MLPAIACSRAFFPRRRLIAARIDSKTLCPGWSWRKCSIDWKTIMAKRCDVCGKGPMTGFGYTFLR